MDEIENDQKTPRFPVKPLPRKEADNIEKFNLSRDIIIFIIVILAYPGFLHLMPSDDYLLAVALLFTLPYFLAVAWRLGIVIKKVTRYIVFWRIKKKRDLKTDDINISRSVERKVFIVAAITFLTFFLIRIFTANN